MGYKVLAEHVTVRTGNTLGIGTGSWMRIGVDRGARLPLDAPPADVAKLLRRGLVVPVDGEVDDDVRVEVARLDAEAQARRPSVPVLSPADRLTNALSRAGVAMGGVHEEFLGALAEFVDERVAAAPDGRSVGD